MSGPLPDHRTERTDPADLEGADRAALERAITAYVERTALTPPADLGERVAASLAHVPAPTAPVGFARAIATGSPGEAVRGFVGLFALLLGRRRGGSILRLQAAALILVTLLAAGAVGTGATMGAQALGGLLLRPPATTLAPSAVPRPSPTPSPTPPSSPSPGPATPRPTSTPAPDESPRASGPPTPTAESTAVPTPTASEDDRTGPTPSATAEPSGSDDDGSGGSPSGSGGPDGPGGSASPTSSP